MSNQRALTLAIRQYFFANASHVLIMFWHDFGQGRGGAMVAMFVIVERVRLEGKGM